MSTPRLEKGYPFGPFVVVLGRVHTHLRVTLTVYWHIFANGNDLSLKNTVV